MARVGSDVPADIKEWEGTYEFNSSIYSNPDERLTMEQNKALYSILRNTGQHPTGPNSFPRKTYMIVECFCSSNDAEKAKRPTLLISANKATEPRRHAVVFLFKWLDDNRGNLQLERPLEIFTNYSPCFGCCDIIKKFDGNPKNNQIHVRLIFAHLNKIQRPSCLTRDVNNFSCHSGLPLGQHNQIVGGLRETIRLRNHILQPFGDTHWQTLMTLLSKYTNVDTVQPRHQDEDIHLLEDFQKLVLNE